MAAADQSQSDPSGHSGILARIGRNVAWLASSSGVSAVTSIIYTGIAARALGPRGFGGYALILTYGQLIGSLVQFDSWAAVIRYGSAQIERREAPALARLFGFTALMDWLSAAVGIAIALVLIPVAAPYLNWSPAEASYASWFVAVLLITTGSTPTGILRLFNRFDLLAYTEMVAPVIRVLGALGCLWFGGGLIWFLATWALSTTVQVLAQWAAALALRQRLAVGFAAARTSLLENSGIISFMLNTNLSSSVREFWLQCGTLAVGWVAGPVDAGGFRIAYRFAQALTKPIQMVTRALFPEFARLVASQGHAAAKSILVRVSVVAALFAGLVLVVVGLGGAQILRLIAGSDFEFAQPFFFLLTIAAAIDLTGFALTPFHNAHGRAGRVLRSGLVAIVVYAGLILLLTPKLGARGVAWASIGASLTILVQLAVSTWHIIRAVDQRDPQNGTSAAASAEASMVATESFK